jgi:hypothetical protein
MQCQFSVTNKRLKSQQCAVANTEYTYYCEVHKDRYYIEKGVYTYTHDRRSYSKYLDLMHHSDKVWRQGPRGGVKIVKDRNECSPTQYVTNKEEFMKKFMWVKLQAQSFTKGN